MDWPGWSLNRDVDFIRKKEKKKQGEEQGGPTTPHV
jgi:hypothetical protein